MRTGSILKTVSRKPRGGRYYPNPWRLTTYAFNLYPLSFDLSPLSFNLVLCVISCFAMLAEVQPVDLMVITHSQAHGPVKNLQDDPCDQKGIDPY